MNPAAPRTVTETQSSALPPAQPTFVLRGHAAQIHAVAFIRNNSRLLTGDADGWVVSWSTSTKRAVAVWKPHEGAILGLKAWGKEAIITAPGIQGQPEVMQDGSASVDAALVAVPGTNDKGANIFHLPTERRIYTISPVATTDTGMIMTLAFHQEAPSGSASTLDRTFLLSGYESGHTTIHALDPNNHLWSITYLSRPHNQPILSLAPNPATNTFFTSSADATITAHPLPAHSSFPSPNQSRSPSSASSAPMQTRPSTNPPSLLSQALSTSSAQAAGAPPPPTSPVSSGTVSPSQPLKAVQTGHSGQQSLCVRSDGRILATAGWDGRIRIYSAKTLKELAVLKWHREGCYGVAFAEIISDQGLQQMMQPAEGDARGVETTRGCHVAAGAGVDAGDNGSTAPSTGCLAAVRTKRDVEAQTTHWVAAGSKDGKVSLWKIY